MAGHKGTLAFVSGLKLGTASRILDHVICCK